MRNKSLVKKIVATGLAASLLLTALTGCGKDASDTSASGNSDKVTVVKVGSRYDDVEIWEAVNEKLKDENIRVENTAYDSSVNINELLVAGEIDLNVAQHYAYLNYVKAQDEKFSKLTALGDIAISTIDLYSNKYKSIDELPDGAKIAIPNDVNNGGRALSVLEKAGLIKLKEGHDIIPSQTDIVENPKNIVFEEVATSSMISILDDVDAGFAYSPNAVDAGLSPETDPIFKDELDLKNNSTQFQFVIIFTGEEGDENNEVYKKVIDAYHSEEVYKVYKEVFKGSTIPVTDGEPIDLSSY
ncbi:MAG: MetQ/NlpA family ABC transporter substrate-binding protein [Eubacterium sp.]|nr:MetQ/NlpA family ABC transporter substrate-binding protein [Eubacterium sp.]